MIPALAVGAALAVVLIWELWICEGAHLGQRFVVWLYDLAARRYDRIKQFDPDWEGQMLGVPLTGLLGDLATARLLDVGAGTGRTFRAMAGPQRWAEAERVRARTEQRGGLAAEGDLGAGLSAGGDPGTGPSDGPGDGRIADRRAGPTLVALEASRRMLRLGRSLVPLRVNWVQSWAVPLPLASDSFDAVVCLEVTEFTPRPRSTIRELWRVLRPGGWLLISNRVGWQAPLILGRTVSRRRFPKLLGELGFGEVEPVAWQVDYDLAWARKPWS